MTTPVEDILDDENTSYDFTELYNTVVQNKDIILTIPRDQVELLKKGLSVKKSKENQKLKSAGLVASNEAFSFLTYDDEETKETENTKVRVKLGPRTTVNVLKIEVPDDNI